MVAGSNPATPTSSSATKTYSYVNQPPILIEGVNSFVNTSEFLDLLSEVQERYSLSDRELARRLGVSNTHLSYIKRGKRRITAKFITRTLKLPNFSQFLLDNPNLFIPDNAYTYIGDMSRKKRLKTDIGALVEEFLTAKRVEGLSRATLDFYRGNLKRLLWWVEDRNLHRNISNITHVDLRAFLSYVQTTPNRWGDTSISSRALPSMVTVDAYWRTMQAFFSWLVYEGIIISKGNPMRRLPRPRTASKVVSDIPLPLIVQALQKWDPGTFIGARNRAIILVFLDTGVRLSECANLTIDDVNLDSGVLKVWGKGQKQRLVKLGGIALAALKRYLTFRKSVTCIALWVTEKGISMKPGGIQTMIRRLKYLKGGVRWSPHTFRNTFAINYLRGGGDPFTLQILGGWEDLEMPRRYCASLKVEDAFRVHSKASPADRLSI